MVGEDTEIMNYILILFFRFPLLQVLKQIAHTSQTTKTCTENSASKKRVSVIFYCTYRVYFGLYSKVFISLSLDGHGRPYSHDDRPVSRANVSQT